MDPRLLKLTFGAFLAFHGAVSVQSLLPHETEDAVEVACRDLIDVLGENGGYIAAPTHCIQVGTPPENVLAMLRVILGAQGYASALQAARLEPFRLELDVASPAKAVDVVKALQFPVKNGAEKMIFRLESAGETFYEFEVELALGEAPDWWARLPLQPLLEQRGLQDCTEVTLCSSAVPLVAFEWLRDALLQGSDLLWADDLYRESLRPQLHFTPRRGWNNDPNGLFYFNSTWHLFFQHNPFGTAWGNMHWGHATSSDLLHWHEQPIALFQRSLADMAFSGGGCVDISNTSALAVPGEVPLLLFFTSTGRGECLAYSLDGGVTFHEHAANPLVTHHGRDPKVIWYSYPHNPSGGHWVMIVYEELYPVSQEPAGRGYAIYISPDLKSWRRTDFLPGFFECPELFQLPIEDEPGSTCWAIHGALWKGDPPPDLHSVFLLGDFDGDRFTPLSDPLPAHYGPHFYASQVFSMAQSERAEMGRSVMLGWLMGAAYPGMPFSQGMTLPLELSLRRIGGGASSSSGLRLCFNPVAELDSLRTATNSWHDLDISQAEHALNALPDELLDLHLSLAPTGDAPFEFLLGDQPFSYNPETGEASFAGRVAHLTRAPEPIQLRLVVDRSVVEIFVQDGEVAFASMVLFKLSAPRFALRGPAHIRSLTVHVLKSVWEV